MLNFIKNELEELKTAGLFRELKTIDKISGIKVTINGKEYLNFCSNNYLGLAQHPQVVAAAVAATKEFGAGAGASRLISGNLKLHENLEQKLAEFKDRQAAIIFPTGYMANLGVITSLVDENDTVIIDRLNHASIIDACHLSKGRLQVYKHRDMKSLESVLKRSFKYKKKLIVTDSVFSMDGDIAPLPEIVKLAKEHDALTMIDEAHATGVIGSTGRGLEEYFGLEGQVDIVMGTLSKALGSSGGFICGSSELIDYLQNKARSFIYTTALSPADCAAALASLEIIEDDPSLREKLWKNVEILTPLIPLSIKDGEGEKLPIGKQNRRQGVRIPILPIIIGDTNKTMEISRQLFDNGILLSGIRPPSVPEGTSRLRLTITAMHTKKEIACLASLLQELIPA